MKKILILFIPIFAISCNKSTKETAELNIKKYLLSKSEGKFELQKLEVLKLDTLTDLQLRDYLFNIYAIKAEENLKLAKQHNELAESYMNQYKLSKSLNSSSLTQAYKSDFKNNMDKFKMYNDSAKLYNDFLIRLDKIAPDSSMFKYYNAKVHYQILNNDMTVDEGEDMYIFLNKDYNIIEPNIIVKKAHSKLLE